MLQSEMSLPFVTLKWAQSVDGQLADDDDCSQWMSGEQERRYTHFLRSGHDAVLVGAQTFLKDRCALTVRAVPCPHEQPVRVIADPKARLLEEFRKGRSPFADDTTLSIRRTFILTPDFPEIGVIRHNPGIIWVHIAPKSSLEQWIRDALSAFSKGYATWQGRPLRKLMVEGGATILSAFLKEGLASRAEIAVSPLMLGGKKNRIFTDSRLNIGANQKLIYESFEKLGDDILLKYSLSSKNGCQGNES